MMVAIAVLLDDVRQRRHVDLLDATRHLMAFDTTVSIPCCWPVEVVCLESAV